MLALTSGGRVRVPGWPRETTQAGDALRELLSRMGAEVSLDDRGLTVAGRRGGARPRRRPARRRRARPGRRGAVRPGVDTVTAARDRAHPRPRDRPARRAVHRAARPGSDGDRARRRAVLRTGRRCTAAPSTPTPTTGWRTRPWSSAPRSRASSSRTSRPPRRRSPVSPRSGRVCCGERALRRARPGELRAPAPAYPSPHQGTALLRRRRPRRRGHRRPRPLHLPARRARADRHRDEVTLTGPQGGGHRRPGPPGRRHLGCRGLAGADRDRGRAQDRAAAYGGRRRPRRAGDRRQRRPARHRHGAGRPRAPPGPGRPRPRRGVRRRHGPAPVPDQGRPRRPRADARRATARSGCRTSSRSAAPT